MTVTVSLVAGVEGAGAGALPAVQETGEGDGAGKSVWRQQNSTWKPQLTDLERDLVGPRCSLGSLGQVPTH